MNKIIFYILLFLLFIPVQGFSSNIGVSAEVNKNIISENDSIFLKVVIDGEQGNVDTSIITDFKVIESSTGTSVSIINGKYFKKVIYNYILMPLKHGTLKIPALEVSKGNDIFYTREILIKVSKLSSHEKDYRDIFANAKISEKELFLGQQTIYELEFYTAVNFSKARLKEPSFLNFFATETNKRQEFSENINGRNYKVTRIRYVLIPEKTGDFEIEPSVIMCEIPVQQNRDPFNDLFFKNQFFSRTNTRTKKIKTNSIKVKVNELPIYNGKEEFSGLVGKFFIKADIDKTILKTGDSATLTITISGKGNIIDASLSQILIPESFKIYDDITKKKLNLTLQGYSGEKIFKKALVPIKSGSFIIKPINLCYFDIQSNKYKTVSSSSLNLIVGKSQQDATNENFLQNKQTTDKNIKAKSVEFTGHDILALKTDPKILTQKNQLSFYVFIILLCIPCVIFYFLKIFLFFTGKKESPFIIMEKISRESFKKAENSSLLKQDFLKFLYTALISKILSKKGIMGKSLTKDEAEEILISTGYSTNEANEFSKILSDIEALRYGKNSLNLDFKKELIKRCKIFFKTLGVIILCCFVFSFLPGESSANSNSQSGNKANLAVNKVNLIFVKAIQEYKQGKYLKACKEFEKIVEKGIKNGEIYYNIGNSYFKAGNIGRAILWYERSKKIIPFDPDLKFNLNYAENFVKDIKSDSKVNISDILFFWKNMISFRTLQYFSLISFLIFFIYAGIQTVIKRKIFTYAGIFLFFFPIIITSTLFFDYFQRGINDYAVIIKDKTFVRSDFSDNSTKLFVLHSGTKVKVQKRQEKYFKIFFSKGKIGWLKQEDAEII
ncbi:MAG: hypothetical protein B6I26_00485 [Desulfobacteraceae bacterium 4572_130]|nr:MAG: hypothetical protein B6I26_00485 [Desulfobacteraceae bacterium 4572_130]